MLQDSATTTSGGHTVGGEQQVITSLFTLTILEQELAQSLILKAFLKKKMSERRR